jgi:HEAT repeat protein
LASALDIVGQLEEPIAALLRDDDQYLRIEAIRALATKDGPLVRQAIRDALLDGQPLVQQAAEAALAELTRGDTVVALKNESSRETLPFNAAWAPDRATAVDPASPEPGWAAVGETVEVPE